MAADEKKILIVDDEKAIRDAVRMILKYENFATVEAENGGQALDLVAKEQDVAAVLCDVKMPGMDGIEALQRIRELRADLPVVMISGHGTVETAVESTRRGAFDFLEKPLDRDRLLVTLRNALGHSNLVRRNDALLETLAQQYRLLGSSGAMEGLRETIRRIAPTDARVLITGENGTGKELVARNLHLLSDRHEGPWVDLNCAAIPKELIESELFGHEKGAFTGATARKIGKFELAHEGTLFLDEIGDMPLDAQAKVLRVLEEGSVQRVGGSDSIAVDVRVLAATNKDLESEVGEGNFREDLFYRLNVIPVAVPPLRERGEDVIELFQHFSLDLSKKYGRERPELDASAQRHLRSRNWPGNVRELRNLAERVILLFTGDGLSAGDFETLGGRDSPAAGEDGIFAIENFEAFKETAERVFLKRHLEGNGWNIKRTAERLGMQRSNLYKKIDRYGLKQADA